MSFNSFLSIQEQQNLIALLHPHFTPANPKASEDNRSLFFISERKTSSSLTLTQIHIALNFFLVICCFNRTPTTKILTSRHVYIKQVFNHQAHRTCFCRVWKKMTLSVISYFTRHVLYNLLLNANFIFEIENLV